MLKGHATEGEVALCNIVSFMLQDLSSVPFFYEPPTSSYLMHKSYRNMDIGVGLNRI